MIGAFRKFDWLLGATIGLCWTMLVLLGIGFGALLLSIPSLFVFKGRILGEIASKYPGHGVAEYPWIVVILIASAIIVALTFLFFKALLDIIMSVATGDPLTTENAARLERMGWLAIGVKAFGFVAAAIAAEFAKMLPKANLKFDGDLDPSAVMLVLLLFVLARVFRAGAAMRAELEGTV